MWTQSSSFNDHQATNTMNQIFNPAVPFNVPIPGGMSVGRIVKIQGNIPPLSDRFAVNLLAGFSGDIALHVNPRFHNKKVTMNSVQHRNWGHEEDHGHLPVFPGEQFELMILCDPHHFKIAFNGLHFAEFTHRLSHATITNLAVDGLVTVTAVFFEGSPHFGPGHHPHVPHQPPVFAPPTGGHMAYPTPQAPGLGMHYPVGHVPGPHHHYPPGTMPPMVGAYPLAHYPVQPGITSSTPGSYPTTYPNSPNAHKKSSILDKAGMAVAAALGGGAVAHGMGSGGGHNHSKVGMLGGGLGTAAAGAVLTGHNPIKALKKQRKAQKKALKYGVPIAAAGVGAYALHKGMKKLHHGHHGHHYHHGSSSSSSSSSD